MTKAVVLIHGIGEQKPMETLRSFVSAVLPDAKTGKQQYWNKPDPKSELFELRVLQSIGRNKVHFYEYYWAHHVENTKLRHIGNWLRELLFRNYVDIPEPLKNIWLAIWVFGLVFFLSVISGSLAIFGTWFENAKYAEFFSIAAAIISAVVQFYLIYSVGDAARYLSSNPSNIKIRQKIRTEGLALLRSLHDSNEYDKIVVVGHSLGSVIAYDLISRLWIDYSRQYNFEEHESELESLLKNNAPPQPVLRKALPLAGGSLHLSDNETSIVYRQTQQKAFEEMAKWGNKWRISELITLGSPLTYGSLFFAKNKSEFEERKLQRELPTCPPVKDEKGYAYPSKSYITLQSGKRFCPLIYHHAAPFSVTRWTNIYHPAYFGIFGDFIGGPLKGEFGLGIQDYKAQIPFPAAWTIKAHTSYWMKFTPSKKASDNPVAALEILQKLLGIRA